MSIQGEMDRIAQNIANTYVVLDALGADMPAEQNSDNLAATAGSAKAVLYKEQTLTDAQKTQARTNIGAASAAEVSQLSDQKADKNGLTLGIASDGLIYLFVDGSPVGTGIEQGQSGDVFGYVDENNTIVLTGNLPDGTYTFKYEMENGEVIEIGNGVLDSNVYYSVTSTLTNCTISNSAKTVVEGEGYSATITANDGYELSSVTVTMGGSSVAVSGGTISIAEVTGDIVITAVATEIVVNYTDYAQPLTVGRLNSSGNVDSTTTAARVTAAIPAVKGDVIRIKGLDLSVYNMATYIKADGTTINSTMGAAKLSAMSSFMSYTKDGDVYTINLTNITNTVKSVRFSGTLMSGYSETDVIATVNEEIA